MYGCMAWVIYSMYSHRLTLTLFFFCSCFFRNGNTLFDTYLVKVEVHCYSYQIEDFLETRLASSV